MQGLHAHYGKSHILHGVDFQVRAGEVVSLLGRNGSGRSTTLKAIMGLVPPTGGSIALNGRDLAGQRPYTVCRAGIAYVPEEREVFANLTVDENLRMGEQPGSAGAARWTVAQMFDYFPRLKERRRTMAGSLSGGEQQMLTICRSLLGNPQVILVDEPKVSAEAPGRPTGGIVGAPTAGRVINRIAPFLGVERRATTPEPRPVATLDENER